MHGKTAWWSHDSVKHQHQTENTSPSLSFCAGEWFPHGAECHRLHFQHHRDRSEQILLHLSLILLQSAVQLSQHSAVCCLNLGAHCSGNHPQFLRRLPALRPEGLLLHLRPECQQFLHRGGRGGSLFCSHRSGYLLLSTHLGACDSGQSSASLLLHMVMHLQAHRWYYGGIYI